MKKQINLIYGKCGSGKSEKIIENLKSTSQQTVIVCPSILEINQYLSSDLSKFRKLTSINYQTCDTPSFEIIKKIMSNPDYDILMITSESWKNINTLDILKSDSIQNIIFDEMVEITGFFLGNIDEGLSNFKKMSYLSKDIVSGKIKHILKMEHENVLKKHVVEFECTLTIAYGFSDLYFARFIKNSITFVGAEIPVSPIWTMFNDISKYNVARTQINSNFEKSKVDIIVHNSPNRLSKYRKNEFGNRAIFNFISEFDDNKTMFVVNKSDIKYIHSENIHSEININNFVQVGTTGINSENLMKLEKIIDVSATLTNPKVNGVIALFCKKYSNQLFNKSADELELFFNIFNWSPHYQAICRSSIRTGKSIKINSMDLEVSLRMSDLFKYYGDFVSVSHRDGCMYQDIIKFDWEVSNISDLPKMHAEIKSKYLEFGNPTIEDIKKIRIFFFNVDKLYSRDIKLKMMRFLESREISVEIYKNFFDISMLREKFIDEIIKMFKEMLVKSLNARGGRFEIVKFDFNFGYHYFNYTGKSEFIGMSIREFCVEHFDNRDLVRIRNGEYLIILELFEIYEEVCIRFSKDLNFESSGEFGNVGNVGNVERNYIPNKKYYDYLSDVEMQLKNYKSKLAIEKKDEGRKKRFVRDYREALKLNKAIDKAIDKAALELVTEAFRMNRQIDKDIKNKTEERIKMVREALKMNKEFDEERIKLNKAIDKAALELVTEAFRMNRQIDRDIKNKTEERIKMVREAFKMNKEFDEERIKMVREALKMNKEFDEERIKMVREALKMNKEINKCHREALKMNKAIDKAALELVTEAFRMNRQIDKDIKNKTEERIKMVREALKMNKEFDENKDNKDNKIKNRENKIKNLFQNYEGDILKDIESRKFGYGIRIDSIRFNISKVETAILKYLESEK